MARRWWLPRRGRGSAPTSWTNISYSPDYPQHDYQTKWVWPWPTVPAHETRGALTNAWTGNQLPGPTNYIPGVGLSKATWNVPTSYANTLKNQQYNVGFNIQSASAWNSAYMQAIAMQAWQNRTGYTAGG